MMHVVEMSKQGPDFSPKITPGVLGGLGMGIAGGVCEWVGVEG